MDTLLHAKRSPILVVEDESIVAMDIVLTLERAGFLHCSSAKNPKEAYHYAKKCPPVVLICDINLGEEENGIDVAKTLHTHFGCAVVFLTAYNDTKTLEEVAHIPFAQYLSKPYTSVALLSMVKLALLRHTQTLLHFGEHAYNPFTKTLSYREKTLVLTHNETLLFHLLALKEGALLGEAELDNTLWPFKAVSQTTKRTLIHRLRQKIAPLQILKVSNLGYRLT
jgi:DNA-binding response OmpR family regulator